MNKLFYLFIFIIFLNSIFVSAECISTTISKEDYLPSETVQVEILSTASKEIKTTDLMLYNYDVQAYTQFNLIKLSNQKYFLFFDIPQSSGDYYLKIKNYCNNNLETYSAKIITKEPIERFYSNLKDSLKNNLYSVSLDQIVLAGKIFQYDKEFHEQMYSAYTNRPDNCIKKECDIQWISLSSIAFPIIKEQMLNKIREREISIAGQWKIILQDPSSRCNLSINGGNETELVSSILDLTGYNQNPIILSLRCENQTTAKITHIQGNASKEFNFTRNGDILSYNIENTGCYSKIAGGSCDINSTIYSLLALKENNYPINQGTLSWLYSQNLTNSDKAIVYYLAGDINSLNTLISVQSQYGWFPLINEKYKEDVLTTSRIIFAMDNLNAGANYSFSDSIIKAENYLRNKFYPASPTTKENLLWFTFPETKIEPLVSIWPGIIQTKSLGKFDLILRNDGKNNISVKIKLLNSTQNYNFSSKTIKKLTFNVPFIGTTDARTIIEDLEIISSVSDLNGIERGYNIPLIILTNKSAQDVTSGTINSSSDEIGEEDIPSTLPDYNYTDSDLIQKNFYFSEKGIKQNIASKMGEQTFSITLKNKFESEIKNIEITTSSSLITLGPQLSIGFVNSLSPNTDKKIDVIINPNNVISSKQYSGEIIAKGYLNNQKVETKIPVEFNITVEENKSCKELGGKECGTSESCTGSTKNSNDVAFCCVGECKGTGGNQTIGFIILGAVVVLLLGVLFFLKRKPRKETSEFIKEAEKRYEHTFQRPASSK